LTLITSKREQKLKTSFIYISFTISVTIEYEFCKKKEEKNTDRN